MPSLSPHLAVTVREATWFFKLKRRIVTWLGWHSAPAQDHDSPEPADRVLEQMLYESSTANRGWMRLDERLKRGTVHFQANVTAARDVIGFISNSPLIHAGERQDLEDDLYPYGACVFEPLGDGISIADARCPLIVVGSEPSLHVLYLERPLYLGGRYEQLPQTLLALLTPDARTHVHLCAKLRLALSDDPIRKALLKHATASEMIAVLKDYEERMAACDLAKT